MIDPSVELSDEQRRKIFENRIIPALDAASVARRPVAPVAVLLGGQPGAGKSHHLKATRNELEAAGRTWVVNGDEMYAFHPQHDNLIRQHGSIAALEMLKGEAGVWVKMALAEAQRRKVNIVMETTMRQPEVVQRQADEFRASGYRVHAKVMAVPAEESLVANRFRYELQHAAQYAARLTPRATHDAAYSQLLTTVDGLEKGRSVDRIDIVRRSSTEAPIYTNRLVSGEWERAPLAAASVQAERERPWSLQRVAALAKSWDSVELMAGKRLAEQKVPPERRGAELSAIAAERREGEQSVRARNERAGREASPIEQGRVERSRER